MFREKFSSDDFSGPGSDKDERRDIKLESVLNDAKIEHRWITADSWKFDDDYWSVTNECYGGRNYYLFGILAGVRGNGGDFGPISEPRGIPSDVSRSVQVILDDWGSDGHSESYFTLQELLDVDWDKYKKDDWLDEFMDTIESLKKVDPDPNKVRIVFFFDN
jgi:hypothetical protein